MKEKIVQTAGRNQHYHITKGRFFNARGRSILTPKTQRRRGKRLRYDFLD